MSVKNNVQDLFNVNGMVAVVTGGGSGLGLYAARALDANGAKAVYIIGRRGNVLEEAAKTAKNGTIIPVTGDVTDKSSLTKIAEQIRQEHGYVNLLFNNAGVNGPRDQAALKDKKSDPNGKPTIKEIQEALWAPEMEDYTKTLHINCTGVYYTTIAFLELLDAGNKNGNLAQDSQVIVTSSVAGLSRFLASSYAYSTSKAAVNHLVKMLSTFFAQNSLRIRVNVVCPGLYPSEMTQRSTSELDKYEGKAFDGAHVMPIDRSPSGRTGSEQDFAGLILFLASQAGAYLNGDVMVTDGGRLSQLPATY